MIMKHKDLISWKDMLLDDETLEISKEDSKGYSSLKSLKKKPMCKYSWSVCQFLGSIWGDWQRDTWCHIKYVLGRVKATEATRGEKLVLDPTAPLEACLAESHWIKRKLLSMLVLEPGSQELRLCGPLIRELTLTGPQRGWQIKWGCYTGLLGPRSKLKYP